MAFHLVDAQSQSWFCRIGIADKRFKKSALNKIIKAISATNWQMINTYVLGYAKRAIDVIKDSSGADLGVVAMSWQIDHYVQLAEKVIDQTQGRVMQGWDSFKSYVWSSIVAANLLTIARAKPK